MANATRSTNNDRIATTATTHAPTRATTPTRAHQFLWQYCRRHSKRRIKAIEQRSTDELDAALLQATVDGDLGRVQQLVSQGANRHVQHSAAMLESHVTYDRQAFDTPLEAAAWLGHDNIVRYFLEQQHEQQQRSSRRLLFKKRSSRLRHLEKEASSSDLALDHEAFLVACQGGSLATVQAFVQHFGPEIITQPCPNVVTPLHYACARCHLPLMQYLLSQGGGGGARLDQPAQRGGAAPIFWLGMFVEMKRSSSTTHADDDSSPIPLPERDDLSPQAYEAALAWIIQHFPAALLATDHRGTTALERLLKRAPMGLIRTAIVHLVAEPVAPRRTQT